MRIRSRVSDWTERSMGFGRQMDGDRVAGAHWAASKHNAHDAGTARALAASRPMTPKMLLQARTVAVHLGAGCAETGYLDYGTRTKIKSRAAWQRQEAEAFREDVFADFAGAECVPIRCELSQHLGGEQMHLAQVGLPRVAPPRVEVLDCRATVRVTLHALARDQGETGLRLFREAVFGCA